MHLAGPHQYVAYYAWCSTQFITDAFVWKVDKSFLSIEDSRHHHLAIHTRRSGITTVNATLQPIRPPEGCVAEMYTTPAPVSTVLTISIDERIVVSPTCPIHLPFAEDSAAHTFQLSSSEGSLKHTGTQNNRPLL